MFGFGNRYFAYSAWAILLSAVPALAADNCSALLRSGLFSARQIVDRSSLQVISSNELRQAPASGVLDLGYIVPNYPWDSGALVLKIRHRLASGSVASSATPSGQVALYRETHVAPCSKRVKLEYSRTRDTIDYINYHRYKSYDDDLDAFHTEIGKRPASILGFETARCRTTTVDVVRSQFLFDDDPSIRRAPSNVQVVRNLTQNVQGELNALGGKPAVAQTFPRSYSEYVDLKSMIVPYRKPADQPACLGVSIKIPGYAAETDIMAVNSDDALVYAPEQDPQTSWHIVWRR